MNTNPIDPLWKLLIQFNPWIIPDSKIKHWKLTKKQKSEIKEKLKSMHKNIIRADGKPQAIEFAKLTTTAIIPTRAHPTDAGLDLYCDNAEKTDNGIYKIHTGIAAVIPPGYVGMVCDRSSMGKNGYKVLGGIIDSGYVGEIVVMLASVQDTEGADYVKQRQPVFQEFPAMSKIAQMLILPVALLEPREIDSKELPSTTRGDKGFGSTGK